MNESDERKLSEFGNSTNTICTRKAASSLAYYKDLVSEFLPGRIAW